MDNFLRSLTEVQERLSASSIESVLIGGLAVAIWGEPRITKDIDFKVSCTRDKVRELLSVLGEGYKLLLPDAIEQAEMLGVLFLEDRLGTRIDLLLADMPYDEFAVSRGVRKELSQGVSARVCTAEDLVIYKLLSTRPRDHEDARIVVLRQGASLDAAYVRRWLRDFEAALDDSTLVATFDRLAAQGCG